MVQNAVKILTLGFFISMITGFVMYRSGYFDSENTSHLQTSHNGGELLANVDQDTNRSHQINQMNSEPIMPSSKSLTPVIELDPGLEREIMSSSKSMLHPIEIESPSNQKIKKKARDEKLDHELMVPGFEYEKQQEEAASDKSASAEIDVDDTPEEEAKPSKGIDWGLIGMGVLGICFVGIGAIVYFKRKSK